MNNIMKTLNGYEIYDDYSRKTLVKQSDAIAIERARIDKLVAFSEGSTDVDDSLKDKELIDLRTGADGIEYDSAGTAVRTNINKIPRMEISDSVPANDNISLWIKSAETEEFVVPQTKDDEISMNDTWSSAKIVYSIGLDKVIDVYTKQHIITSDFIWSTSSEDGNHILLPIEDVKMIEITANKNEECIFALLRDNYVNAGDVPHSYYKRESFVDEYGEDEENIIYDDNNSPVPNNVLFSVPSRSSLTVFCYPECKYLYIQHLVKSGEDYINTLPSNIKLDNIEIMTKEKVSKLSTVFYDDFSNGLTNWEMLTLNTNDPNCSSRFVSNNSVAYIDGNCLVLRCHKTNDTALSGGKKYISPYISTQSKFAIRSGRISAKIKAEKEPANGFPFKFFTLGQNNVWPVAPEFDILDCSEIILKTGETTETGNTYPTGALKGIVGTNIHYYKDGKDSVINHFNEIAYNRTKGSPSIVEFKRKNYKVTDWHIYAVEWNENYITYTIDDVVCNQIAISDLNSDSIFNSPQDIRLNITSNSFANDDSGSVFVEWVKAESIIDSCPVTTILHDDVELNVGESIYCSPIFAPEHASNVAFTLNANNDNVTIENFTDNYGRGEHKITAVSSGESTVTITAANGIVTTDFVVSIK